MKVNLQARKTRGDEWEVQGRLDLGDLLAVIVELTEQLQAWRAQDLEAAGLEPCDSCGRPTAGRVALSLDGQQTVPVCSECRAADDEQPAELFGWAPAAAGGVLTGRERHLYGPRGSLCGLTPASRGGAVLVPPGALTPADAVHLCATCRIAASALPPQRGDGNGPGAAAVDEGDPGALTTTAAGERAAPAVPPAEAAGVTCLEQLAGDELADWRCRRPLGHAGGHYYRRADEGRDDTFELENIDCPETDRSVPNGACGVPSNTPPGKCRNRATRFQTTHSEGIGAWVPFEHSCAVLRAWLLEVDGAVVGTKDLGHVVEAVRCLVSLEAALRRVSEAACALPRVAAPDPKLGADEAASFWWRQGVAAAVRWALAWPDPGGELGEGVERVAELSADRPEEVPSW